MTISFESAREHGLCFILLYFVANFRNINYFLLNALRIRAETSHKIGKYLMECSRRNMSLNIMINYKA